MKHQVIAYTLNGDYIKAESFKTADEAYECQVNWLKDDAQIMVARLNDGYIMTMLQQEDILD